MVADLWVRDQLWLLAHDDEHHLRPRIHPGSLAVGLAGALLVDLAHTGRVQLASGVVTLIDHYDRTLVGDPIADQVLATLRTAHRDHRLPQHARPAPTPTVGGARDVITQLSTGLLERTTACLVASGLLLPTRSRLGRTRYRLADPTVMSQIRGAPRAALLGRGTSVATDALCLLVGALRLHDALYLDSPEAVSAAIGQARSRLGQHGSPRCLDILAIAEAVDAATGDLTVAVYR